ncbi:hypothetical protein [Escherichia coli]|uniref:hypothetical protein n=1 Tax=Escherichia coli TaxID=562 RepID=UPI0002A20787|nr:hypothetical protein [Escherichia coli]ELE31995.1 hypothetical protein A1SW_03094 [Escherichia coli KTE62]MDO2026034.1 hypothetical protein [Escherichia coli]MDO2029375.1 hypothetical protein [Escherichia coli]GCM80114.1 hypothetical protein ExPECSC034_02795 [Escherichia coli]GCP05928.1 hypothetical protein ExPECSC027_02416 [Escherichia coli]
MADWQIPIIILAGASLVAGFILLKKHKDRDQKVEVLYGYPANSTTWLTIYHTENQDAGYSNGMICSLKSDQSHGETSANA